MTRGTRGDFNRPAPRSSACCQPSERAPAGAVPSTPTTGELADQESAAASPNRWRCFRAITLIRQSRYAARGRKANSPPRVRGVLSRLRGSVSLQDTSTSNDRPSRASDLCSESMLHNLQKSPPHRVSSIGSSRTCRNAVAPLGRIPASHASRMAMKTSEATSSEITHRQTCSEAHRHRDARAPAVHRAQ